VKTPLLKRSKFVLPKSIVVGENPKTGTTNKPTQKLKHIIQLSKEPKNFDLVFIISLSGLNNLL
jgi:hypothetical protein